MKKKSSSIMYKRLVQALPKPPKGAEYGLKKRGGRTRDRGSLRKKKKEKS